MKTLLAAIALALVSVEANAACALGTCIEARPSISGGRSSGGYSGGGSGSSRSESADRQHFRGGDYYEKQGNLDAAAEQYRLAIANDPNWPGYRNALARVLHRLKDYAGALEAYRGYFALKSESSITAGDYSNVAYALWGLKRFKDAEEFLAKAIRRDPNFADAQENLARLVKIQKEDLLADGFDAAYRESNPERAEALYRQYLLVNPNNSGALNNLGYALEQQGRYVAAEAAYREALRVGENERARNNLARVAGRGDTSAFRQLQASRVESVAASREMSIEAIKGRSIACFDDSRGCSYTQDNAMEKVVLAPRTPQRPNAPIPPALQADREFAGLQQSKQRLEKEYKETYDALQAAWALKDSGRGDKGAIELLIVEQKDKLTRERSAIRATEIQISKKYEDLGFRPPE